MNLYAAFAASVASPDATTLSARLSDWHDAMVAHERRLKAGTDNECDDECPHVTARDLWLEAQSIFGDRARELVYLRAKGQRRELPARRLRSDQAGDSAGART